MLSTWIKIVPSWIEDRSNISGFYAAYFSINGPLNFLRVIGDLIAINGLVLDGIDYHAQFWKAVIEEFQCQDLFAKVIIGGRQSF